MQAGVLMKQKGYDINEIKDMLQLTRQGAVYRIKKEGWNTKKIRKEGKLIYLYYPPEEVEDETTKSALVESQKKKAEQIDELTNEQRKVVEARLFLCMELEKRLEKSCCNKGDIIKKFTEDAMELYPEKIADLKGLKGKLCDRTIREWYSKYESKNFNPVELAPRYGIAKRGRRKLSEEARQEIIALYLNENKLKVTTINDQLMRKGIIAENKTGIIRNFVKKDLPQYLQDFGRLGEKEYKDKYEPFVTRGELEIKPNDIWVSDGHDFEMMCQHPTKKDKKGNPAVVTPKVIAWMDMKTNLLTGFVIAFEETTEAIMSALKDGITKWGKPKKVYTDNGKAYRSRQIEGNKRKRDRDPELEETNGIYQTLGIEVTHANPYNAQAKPIERRWQNVKEFSKFFKTYKGGKTSERPEKLKEILKDYRNAPTYEDFCEAFERFVEFDNSLYYENRGGHRGAGMNGRSPLQAMNEWLPIEQREMIDPKQLRLLCMYREYRTIQQNGISIYRQVYSNDVMSMYTGQKIEARYDPKDLSKIYVYKLTGEYMFEAEFTGTAGFENIDALKENMKVKSKQKKLRSEQLALAKRATETDPYIKGITVEDMKRLEIKRKTEENEKPAKIKYWEKVKI